MCAANDNELKALVRERFTRTAEVFGDYAVAHRVADAELLARMVCAGPNDRAVDLACGPGTLALRLCSPRAIDLRARPYSRDSRACSQQCN